MLKEDMVDIVKNKYCQNETYLTTVKIFLKPKILEYK